MNIILLAKEEVVDQEVTLMDYRAEHIVKILRSQTGDRIVAGIINGKMGYGIIKEISHKRPYRVSLLLTLEKDPSPPPQIDIVLALPRPIMFRRIISQLTALGVGRIYVINSARVEKSFWDASVTADGQWQKHVVAGLEQAVDTKMVELTFHRGFKPFLENSVTDFAADYRQMLVAHPGSGAQLKEVFKPGRGRTLVAIGPEGGWSPYEIEKFTDCGFAPFSIGPRILRVETAVTVMHAMVSLLQQS